MKHCNTFTIYTCVRPPGVKPLILVKVIMGEGAMSVSWECFFCNCGVCSILLFCHLAKCVETMVTWYVLL